MVDTLIKTGDRFIKTGNPTTVWVVEHTVDFHDLEPHVRLAEEERPRRKITLSNSALLDRSLHQRQPSD